jgi:hypothetical protein
MVGAQANKKRLVQAHSGGGCRGNTAARPIDAIETLTDRGAPLPSRAAGRRA